MIQGNTTSDASADTGAPADGTLPVADGGAPPAVDAGVMSGGGSDGSGGESGDGGSDGSDAGDGGAADGGDGDAGGGDGGDGSADGGTPAVPTNTYDGARTTTVSFDAAWRFTLGDPSNAQAPTFNDSAWTLLDVPHDWSISQPFAQNSPAGSGGGYDLRAPVRLRLVRM